MKLQSWKGRSLENREIAPRAPITIDEMHEMLDEIVEEFPPAFFTKLNGGISLLPDVRYSPHARSNDLYTLGEYRRDAMGRYIYLYYGSIMRTYGYLPREKMRRRLWKLVSHELTHHIEDLAGERGLEKKDKEQIQQYLDRHSDDA